jgi:hypothetical protein
VLPLRGRPTEQPPQTLSIRAKVHATLGRVLQRGRCDGSIRADATAIGAIVQGAMLAQDLPNTGTGTASLSARKVAHLKPAVPRPAEPKRESKTVSVSWSCPLPPSSYTDSCRAQQESSSRRESAVKFSVNSVLGHSETSIWRCCS